MGHRNSLLIGLTVLACIFSDSTASNSHGSASLVGRGRHNLRSSNPYSSLLQRRSDDGSLSPDTSIEPTPSTVESTATSEPDISSEPVVSSTSIDSSNATEAVVPTTTPDINSEPVASSTPIESSNATEAVVQPDSISADIDNAVSSAEQIPLIEPGNATAEPVAAAADSVVVSTASVDSAEDSSVPTDVSSSNVTTESIGAETTPVEPSSTPDEIDPLIVESSSNSTSAGSDEMEPVTEQVATAASAIVDSTTATESTAANATTEAVTDSVASATTSGDTGLPQAGSDTHSRVDINPTSDSAIGGVAAVQPAEVASESVSLNTSVPAEISSNSSVSANVDAASIAPANLTNDTPADMSIIVNINGVVPSANASAVTPSTPLLTDWTYCTCSPDGPNGTLVFPERQWMLPTASASTNLTTLATSISLVNVTSPASFLEVSVRGMGRMSIARSDDCSCENPWDAMASPQLSTCTVNHGVNICLVRSNSAAAIGSTKSSSEFEDEANQLLASIDQEFSETNPFS